MNNFHGFIYSVEDLDGNNTGITVGWNGGTQWDRGRMTAANAYEPTGEVRGDFSAFFQSLYPEYTTLSGNPFNLGGSRSFTNDFYVRPRVISGSVSAINVRIFVIVYEIDANPNGPHA